jgi:IS5 family transposase
MGGQIIDATLIAAPRQKLTLEENATIREGDTPEGWSRAKRAQKDQDARWTLKRGRAKPQPDGTQRQAIQIAMPIFGYKSHNRHRPAARADPPVNGHRCRPA